MAKTPSGTMIAYGSVLPPGSTTSDGALFFKTDPDASGPAGLYLYSYIRDVNLIVPGAQVAQQWSPAVVMTGLDASTLQGIAAAGFQPVNQELTNLAANTGIGFFTRTGSGTVTRNLVAGAGIIISNAAGIAGNPTLTVDQAALTRIGNLTGYIIGNGIGAFTSSLTVAATDIANGTANINISGVAANATNANYANSAGAALTANHATALTTPRAISISGAISGAGTVSFDGSANLSIVVSTLSAANLTGTVPTGSLSGSYNINISGSSATAGTAGTAGALSTARSITLSGGVSGSTSFDGSTNVAISAVVANDSHLHSIYMLKAGDTMSGTLTVLSNINASGNITASGNVTAYSDARLKKDIELITNAVQKVQSLKGVTFTRKSTGERGIGLLAQDVQAVQPEAVVTDETGLMSVAYGNLVGLLVEAIKAQQLQLDALMLRI